ncbi:MAG: hypothetical protein JRH20_32560 [Deltaproteobacteria bacterium]|nr:hypothetical protein [Deltaproteobacteria bacterium]
MTQQSEANTHFSRATEQLEGIGKSWANYGRTVGKAALEHSAEALKTSAGFLSQLSAKLDPAVEVKPETDKETTEPAAEE